MADLAREDGAEPETQPISPKPSPTGLRPGERRTNSKPGVGVVSFWFQIDRDVYVAQFEREFEGETYALCTKRPTVEDLVEKFSRVVDLVLMHTVGLPDVEDALGNKVFPPTLPASETDRIRSETHAMLKELVRA